MPPAPTPTPAPNDPINDMSLELAKVRRDLMASIEVARDLSKEFKLSSASLKSSFEFATDTKHALDDARSIITKIGREYVDQEVISERIKLNNYEIKAINASVEDAMKKMKKPLADQDVIYGRISKKINSANEVVRAKVTAEQTAFYNLKNEIKAREAVSTELGKANTLLDDGNKTVKEMQLKASALSKIFGSLTGIPFLRDFMDFKKIAADFEISNKLGFKTLTGEIKRVFTNPLFLALIAATALIAGFKALVKLAYDYDKIITDIANNTALSKDSTKSMMDSFRAISGESVKLVGSLDAAYLSVKNQANALIELGDSLETNALFTNEMIQNQMLLTKQMKMSKEEAAGIQKMSLLTGQSAEKILNTAMKQNTTAISYKKIFSEISKVNSEIATAYKNNPELIAKAVVEANKLGMSLEQTKSISKSLLDFETSIAGELESELLLGKRFNFEKARALALDGKSVEAASELMGQIGGINALTQMNVIQRERLAASIGMSAEELTKSAREQAILNSLGAQNKKALEERYEILRRNGDVAGMEKLKAEAARKEGGQALIQDIARANLQDRFNESMERIKQIFTELAAGPMMTFLGGITKILQNTTLLKAILVATAVVVGAIAASLTAAAIAITIAMGGANLAAAAAVIGGGIGLGAVGIPMMLSGTNTAGEAALPNKNNLPTYNNNQQGNNAAGNQRSDEQRRIEIYNTLNMDGKAVSTVMKSSDYSYS
jgi:hypothetical protein